ncbi:MAG: class B sortase [Clostridia bacterium]|nr:class B sortase [Clostridia bacterium]
MPNNENNNQNKKLPDGLSSIADDEAITEIDLGDFLEESTKSAPLFEGFHEDIENTEKSLESDLQNLYDDIMSSGPETIVPKPMSVLTEKESPKSALDELWMNPEDYFDADIPVVSLDEDEIEEEIPEEAFFNPEAAEEAAPEEDFERNSIFSLIDSLKSESDVETGFSEILSEIESNEGIATTIDGSLADAQRLVSQDYTPEESFEEVSFGDEEIDWNDIETEDEAPAEEYALPVEDEAPAEETAEISVDDIVKQYATAKPEAASAPSPVAPAAEASFDVDNIDTNSEEFDRELAFLLGDKAAEAAGEEASAQTGFVINVPDDGNDYEKAAAAPEKLYEAAPMSTIPVEESLEIVTEDDGKKKKKKKDKKNKNKDNAQAAEKEGKKSGGAGEVVRKIILSVSIITIIVSCGILVNTYFIEPMRFKSGNDDLVAQMQENINANGDSTEIADEVKQQAAVDFPEGMLAKYAQLYAANDDLRGWISIPGFDINLPIAQGTDNNFYLKKDIYGKYTTYGVPFFDYRMTDFKNLHKNTVVYGHNMRHDDLIFGMLENYRFIEAGFQKAPVIECNTIYGDFTWFVYAAFISNSDASQDNGYLFPYNFIDVSDGKFADYIAEIDKRKFYTTGVDIQPTDKILTLSTCCYDFEDARLVVVARLRREGESVAVDTSRAYLNDDIKYPQIWYDVNKKTNNHASDPRW